MRHGSQSKQHTSCYGGKKEPAMRHHETVSGELVYSTRLGGVMEVELSITAFIDVRRSQPEAS